MKVVNYQVTSNMKTREEASAKALGGRNRGLFKEQCRAEKNGSLDSPLMCPAPPPTLNRESNYFECSEWKQGNHTRATATVQGDSGLDESV
jgi:hypothetical protein